MVGWLTESREQWGGRGAGMKRGEDDALFLSGLERALSEGPFGKFASGVDVV
jgi:hypothetical protein